MFYSLQRLLLFVIGTYAYKQWHSLDYKWGEGKADQFLYSGLNRILRKLKLNFL